MSDEPQPPLTGDVHEASDGKTLVPQPNGGALQRGPSPRVTNPTAADNAAKANAYIHRLLPGIRRIAANEQDPRRAQPSRAKTEKGRKGTASRRAKFSVNQRLAAFGKLLEAAKLDRAIGEARLAAFLLKVQDEILEYLPREQADTLLRKIAVHVSEL